MTNQEINAELCRIEEELEGELVVAEADDNQALADSLARIRQRINHLRRELIE